MIKFECNGCGKCCKDTTPSLTLSEFLRLYKIMPSLVIFEFYKKNKLNNANGFEFKNKFDEIFIILGQIIAIPTFDGCMSLTNENRCEIYEQRPSVCAMYPISAGVQVGKVGEYLQLTKASNSSLSDEGYCEGWENTDSVIFQDDALVNKFDIELINKRAIDDIETEELLKKLFIDLFKFEYVQEELNNNEKGELLVCTEDFLLFLQQKNIIDEALFLSMHSTQKDLFYQAQLSYQDGCETKFNKVKRSMKEIVAYNSSTFEN